MATVKVILRKNKANRRGLAPLYLQLIHNRKTTEISLRKYIEPIYWDEEKQKIKRSHSSQGMLNAIIKKERRKLEDIIDEKDLADTEYNIKDIVAKYKGELQGDEKEVVPFIEHFIETNPENLAYVTLGSYKKTKNCIKEFSPGISFNKLHLGYFQEYEKYLLKQGKAINTVSDRMKILRKVMGLGIKAGHIDKDPMVGYKRKYEEGKREFLTQDELAAFSKYYPRKTLEISVKDAFLFACYTGLRFSDLATLTPDDFLIDGKEIRLNKQMSKTKNRISMKLNSIATAIYRNNMKRGGIYLLPILDEQRDLSTDKLLSTEISRRNAHFNKDLKQIITNLEIDKNISFHCARHTFATIGLSLGIRIEVLSKLLGHKNIKETQIYAKIMNPQKDEAIDLFDKIA
jgi:site-specific recombinase XerD